MIDMNTYATYSFAICYGTANLNDLIINGNTELGVFNQAVYVNEGSAVVNNQQEINVGLNDMISYYETPLEYKVTSNNFSWVAVNPVPNNTRFNIEVIKNTTQQVTTANQNQYIVCVSDDVFIDNVQLLYPNFYQISIDSTVTVNAINGTCLVLTPE